MRLGLIDIDTSHPGAWTPLLHRMGHTVTAVCDGGAMRSPEEVAEFAAAHGNPAICNELPQMLPLVDGVIVHSCNWDLHVERARPFVEAGKAVLLDKPMAGCLRDLRQVAAWARSGARITGGSSLRFTTDARQFLDLPVADRGEVKIVMAGCGTDEFNYGIHGYAMLWSVMGPGARTVRWLADSPQWQAEIIWDSHRRAILTVGGDVGWLRTYATVITSRGVHHIAAGGKAEDLYQPMLDAVMPYLSGTTGSPPLPMDILQEPELAALAVLESRRRGGAVVALHELTEDVPGYDGDAFEADYRRRRKKK